MTKFTRTMFLATTLFALLTAFAALPAAAQLTSGQIEQYKKESAELRAAITKLRMQMKELRSNGEPIPDDLKQKNHELSQKLLDLNVAMRNARRGGTKPNTDSPTTTNPTVPKPRTTPTSRPAPPKPTGEVAEAIDLAQKIVANEQAFDESLEPLARAQLTGDKYTIKEAQRPFNRAFSNWTVLRRKRPSVSLPQLLEAAGKHGGGKWSDVARWSETDFKAFNDWAAKWQEVRITFEGTVESVKFNRTLTRCQVTVQITADDKRVDVPLAIEARSTRVYMLEHANKGDLIQGEVIIKSAGPLEKKGASYTLPLRSYEARNTRGDRLFAQAKTDSSLHDKWVKELRGYEYMHVQRPLVWHPVVTVEQWFAGCPAKNHDNWKTPNRWPAAQKRAFDRWIKGSYSVRLLATTVVEEIAGSNKFILRGKVVVDGLPITLLMNYRSSRKLPVANGEKLYATMKLGSYFAWSTTDEGIEIKMNTNVGRKSATPIDVDGKPIKAGT